MPNSPTIPTILPPTPAPSQRQIALSMVAGAWVFMVALAIVQILLHRAGPLPTAFLNVALLALAAAALTAALYRARHTLRAADAFLSLTLLNPLLYTHHAAPLDPTLLGAALLGLIAAAILAMKRDNFLRYLAVLLLTLVLSWVSSTFLMLLPALVAWFIFAGYALARSEVPSARRRGLFIMALGEAGFLLFGLACILIDPTQSPEPATLFSTITSFADFPLLILAILLLSLGWHTRSHGPHHTTPPYFAGMLALLVGLFTMLLNNFQSGILPPPGTDQSILVLCLLYTVSALHGPRRLQPFVPPILLILAILYTFFR